MYPIFHHFGSAQFYNNLEETETILWLRITFLGTYVVDFAKYILSNTNYNKPDHVFCKKFPLLLQKSCLLRRLRFWQNVLLMSHEYIILSFAAIHSAPRLSR